MTAEIPSMPRRGGVVAPGMRALPRDAAATSEWTDAGRLG